MLLDITYILMLCSNLRIFFVYEEENGYVYMYMQTLNEIFRGTEGVLTFWKDLTLGLSV
jgi:hypothetical protein